MHSSLHSLTFCHTELLPAPPAGFKPSAPLTQREQEGTLRVDVFAELLVEMRVGRASWSAANNRKSHLDRFE